MDSKLLVIIRGCAVHAAALALAACAVNPLTPTPQPTETRPPVVVVVVSATPSQPPAPTPTPRPTLALKPESAEPDLPASETVAAELSAGDLPATAAPQATSVSVALVAPTVAAPTVAAPPTQPPPTPVLAAPPPSGDVAAGEQYTIDLINVERAAVGLPALARDETLMGIARARVADMVARGYTGHHDPVTGESLGRAMMLAAGYTGFVGENWYGSVNGPPAIAEIAMRWFMTDPPHYRNILNPNYTVVGVGIAYNGRQWLLVQNFAGG